MKSIPCILSYAEITEIYPVGSILKNIEGEAVFSCFPVGIASIIPLFLKKY